MSGTWTIGNAVVSGDQAVVDIEYEARDSTGTSVVNTDPNAGLPNSGLSFDGAFQQARRAFDDAMDCVLIAGRWYVYVVVSVS